MILSNYHYGDSSYTYRMLNFPWKKPWERLTNREPLTTVSTSRGDLSLLVVLSLSDSFSVNESTMIRKKHQNLTNKTVFYSKTSQNKCH